MNDSNQIRDAFAHYRYRRASQLLEGDSDAHWVIAYQHADELIDFDSFEAAWVLQESAITAQREALAQMKTERDQYDELHLESIALAARHEQALARVEAELSDIRHKAFTAAMARDTAQTQLAEMRRIVAGFLFNYDDGVGKPWERRLLDYARKLVAAKEFNAQAEQQEAGEMLPRVKHLLPMPAVKPPKPEAQGAQAGDFQREDRYIVIKRKDLEAVVTDREWFKNALSLLELYLPKREYLVIESDWPEYEPTWAAIQARVTGQGELAGDDYFASPEEYAAKRAALATQPAAGEPIQVEAVAVTREDADGLYLDWVLEGGISALEAPGVVLLVAHGTVTDDQGSGEVYLAPPAAAHGDEAGQKLVLPERIDRKQYLGGRGDAVAQGWNDCLNWIDKANAMRAQGDGEAKA